jgi:hypothetical protein
MTILAEWKLDIGVDEILRGQGADPDKIRARSPRLVDLAEKALEEGLPLLKPQVLYERYKIKEFRHQRIVLENGTKLSGDLITQHLAPATEVIAIICTVGAELENRASEISNEDIVYSLALDGFGSAATEILANTVCHQFEMEAKERDLLTTIPLSPGMMGWTVAEAQPQLLKLLEPEMIGITHLPTLMMLPRKSLSMVVGVGAAVPHDASTCDYCSMKETCRYRENGGHISLN